MSRPIVNTELFREAAKRFQQYGAYCDAPEGTRDWFDYWTEELRRIKEGYSVGGIRITGEHYFYLNYSRMELTSESDALKRGVDREWTFPRFWDGDYEFFWALHIAKYGITQEELDALQLEVSPLDLTGGHHMVVLKARGKGFSYKSGSLLTHSAYVYKGTKNFALAGDWTHLIQDGLLNKAWDVMAHIDAHTAWAQPKLIVNSEHARFGYEEDIGGIWVKKGSMSEIIGISCKDDPDKARGKRGRLLLFEEAGKFPGLLKAWQVARPSVEQGTRVFGTMIAYGTGGTEEADYGSLEELFYNPKGYNVQPFDNIWDEGGLGNRCGYFVPAYRNYEGFMDADGNSDEEGARKYLEGQRQEIRQGAKSNQSLEQAICENPFTPREATLQASLNLFPTAELIAHLNSITVQRRWAALTPGFLSYDELGKVIFRADQKAKPIFDYPLTKRESTEGAVWMLEAPWRDQQGNVPQGLYSIWHDPYANDGVEGGSLGSAYVIKHTNQFSISHPECPVASYVGRPQTTDDYNRILFLLAEYYNAKIEFENNRGDVIPYAKRFHKLQYLAEEPQIIEKKGFFTRATVKPYGITMTAGRKQQGELYIRDWLTEPIKTYEDGSVFLRLHAILDPALLQELIKYNPDGNFDRVMSLMTGMYFLKDAESRHKTVRPNKVYDASGFFEREWFPGSSTPLFAHK